MSNTMFALWIGLSAGILLLFLYAAFLNLRRKQAPGAELGDLMNSFLPVDVEVLSNVIDAAQQRHLQETYGRDELLRIYRKQVALTMECLRRMSHNAALLQQVGYTQLQSGNQLIASLAQEMVDAGVHVRLYTFMALIVLQVRTSLQWLPLFSAANSGDVRSLVSSSLLPAYALLKDKADHLTCLKFSSLHESLAQSL
ncbi:MAG: hypothetical protein JWM83_2013 [Candidatus Angelobacter sp.]|jgi:hypothetical protein|nr:hypothetical protein [Candidatus Angelobacter sp.]HEV7675545.1 hypothetical protein [Candidatus Angelobacter sp.]